MGQGYGKLNRRRGSGAWQWVLIGFLPGVLCGGAVLFGLLLSGMLESFQTPLEVTREVTQMVVVQAPTEDSTTAPTATPFVITATPEPTTDPGESQISIPDPTATQVTLAETTQQPAGQQGTLEEQIAPSPDAAEVRSNTPETDTDTTGTTGNTGSTGSTGNDTGQVSNAEAIPPQLAGIASPMTTVSTQPIEFTMGTTPLEVVQAVDVCLTVHNGACQESYGVDSYPQHRVLLDPYRIEQTEVSFRQYVAFLNYLQQQGVRHTAGCKGFICIQTQNENPNAAITFDGANYNVPEPLLDYPVYGVTWYGAQAYCEAIGGRLPTEAEWEYSAKGSQGLLYPWGNQWTSQNAKTRIPRDAPVGPLPVTDFGTVASPFGTVNQAGNVAEWVSDWYGPNYYSTISNQVDASGQAAQNPTGPVSGTQKVLRGGSFAALPFFARTVHRQSWPPAPGADGSFPNWVGFRCADDLQPAETTGPVDPNNLGSTIPPQDATQPPQDARPALPATTPPEAEQDAGAGTGNRG
jgi:iron(II)-dependent oxidoreductase